MMRGVRRSLTFELALCLSAGLAAQQPATTSWPPPGVYTVDTPGLTRPVAITQVPPRYTRDAMQRQIQGVAAVACVVETNGQVVEARIERSLDREFGLDETALYAARQWRFRPGTIDGKPVRVLITINIGFSIKGAPPTSTLPADFVETPALDTSTWRDDVVEDSRLVIRVRYPEHWTIRRDGPPTRLLLLETANRQRHLSISRPMPMKAPLPIVFPLSVQQLQMFTDGMRAAVGVRDMQSIAIGQGETSGRWWTWQEIEVTPAAFEKMGIAAGLPAAGQVRGARMWLFTSIIQQEVVTLFFTTQYYPIEQLVDRDAAERKSAGALFAQMLRLMTFEPR
jgi:TonB family protein